MKKQVLLVECDEKVSHLAERQKALLTLLVLRNTDEFQSREFLTWPEDVGL